MFFTRFHQVFFSEGSWLFFEDDTLIQLYPLPLWMRRGVEDRRARGWPEWRLVYGLAAWAASDAGVDDDRRRDGAALLATTTRRTASTTCYACGAWRSASGEREGADLEIVRAAALLHDIGRAEEQRSGVCHAQYSAERARDILRGHPAERVEAVAQAIARASLSRGANGPSSLEARVLYDADKLDAIGAIGVARAYAIAGARKQRLWAAVSPAYAERAPEAGRDDLAAGEHTPVHEYFFKLAKLRERMYTATGRQLAEGRHAYMVGYFERLGQEIEGEL